MREEYERYYKELNDHWWGIERKAQATISVASFVLVGVVFIATRWQQDGANNNVLVLLAVTVVAVLLCFAFAFVSFSFLAHRLGVLRMALGMVRNQDLFTIDFHQNMLANPLPGCITPPIINRLYAFQDDTRRKLNTVFIAQSLALLSVVLLVATMVTWAYPLIPFAHTNPPAVAEGNESTANVPVSAAIDAPTNPETSPADTAKSQPQ